MPFTFLHPALVAPLLSARRRYPWLSATGLITGSIAPDFEKFFNLQLASHYSHTLASVFYFSYPVALVLAFLFHLQVRRPLLTHLPLPLHRRLRRCAVFDWPGYFRQHYPGVLLCIGLGAFSHLFWDSFTHYNPLTMRLLPALADPVEIGTWTVPLFRVVELVTSIAGGLVLAFTIWQLPSYPAYPAPSPAAMGRYWGIALVVAAALEIEWVLAIEPSLLNAGIAAITATLIGIVAASVFIKRWRLSNEYAR